MQIKEVTQAEAEASSTAPEDAGQQAGSSSPRKAKSPGIMQSVLGAAKTLLGGKSDEVCNVAVYAAALKAMCVSQLVCLCPFCWCTCLL